MWLTLAAIQKNACPERTQLGVREKSGRRQTFAHADIVVFQNSVANAGF
jgi:hypothetical protein